MDTVDIKVRGLSAFQRHFLVGLCRTAQRVVSPQLDVDSGQRQPGTLLVHYIDADGAERSLRLGIRRVIPDGEVEDAW